MAVGTSDTNNKPKKAIPVTLFYDGKLDKDEILNRDVTLINKIMTINSSNENKLIFDDNLNSLLYLLNNGYRGKIQLIYIDPPFATKSSFVNRKQKHAYSDSLSGGEYVEFLRQRLIILRELLSDNGSIYIHLDNKMAFTMKIIMDEVFGERNFRSFITRKKCSTKNYTKNTFGNISDYIMFYSKTDKYIWNRPYDSWELDKMIEQYPYLDEFGRRYKKVPIHAPGVRNGETGKAWRGKLPPEGKHWQYTPDKLEQLDAAGEIYWSPTGNPRRKVFCDPSKGIPVQDIWLNYRDSINQQQKTTGYPTEKNLDMLQLIVEASSRPGDIVLDCFAGSGTTLDAAQRLGRNWIGIDNGDESIKAIVKRFTRGLDIYGDYVDKNRYVQESLDISDKCGFSIYSVESNKKHVLELLREFNQNK